MTTILRELRITIIAAVLALTMILTAALTNVDLVRLNLKLLEGIEKHERDDLLSAFVLIFVGLAIDRMLSHRRRRREAEIEAQKLRTLRATMRTVQDIVNNFLNNLMVFELEAAATMPSSSLEQLETLIQDTSEKLRALADLESVQETPLAIGLGIAYPETQRLSWKQPARATS